MFNERTEIFLLIKQFLSGDKIDVTVYSLEEFEELYQLAKHHQIHHMLLDVMICDESNKNLKGYLEYRKTESLMNIMRHKKKKQDFPLIVSALEEAGIDYRILKGMSLEQLYSNPDTRKMSDTDVLLRLEDRDQVKVVFERLGYDYEDKLSSKMEDHYHKSGRMAIEAHYELMGDKLFGSMTSLEQGIWVNQSRVLRGHVTFSAPEVGIHLSYMILHLGKHMWGNVVLLRQVIDLILFMERHQIDYKDIEEVLGHHQADKFGWHLFNLIESIKLDQWNKDDGTCSELADYILGTKGKSNGYDKEYFNKSIRRYNEGHQSGRIRYIVRTVCPHLKVMSDQYHYLKRYPFLLPVAWLQRSWRVFNRDWRRVLSFVIAPKDFKKVNKEADLFEQLELYEKVRRR